MSRAEFYRMVSAVLRRLHDKAEDEDDAESMEFVSREFAREFGGHNEKFDAARFLRDCGVEQ